MDKEIERIEQIIEKQLKKDGTQMSTYFLILHECDKMEDKLAELKAENESLKKELINYNSYKTDNERIRDMTNLYDAYTKMNNELKHQLRELPKKIANDIYSTFGFFVADDEYAHIEMTSKDFDNLLKKYEEKNNAEN